MGVAEGCWQVAVLCGWRLELCPGRCVYRGRAARAVSLRWDPSFLGGAPFPSPQSDARTPVGALASGLLGKKGLDQVVEDGILSGMQASES